MVIAIFGERCSGKSHLAQQICAVSNAEVYAGRDYTRFAKNENDAKQAFRAYLQEHTDSDGVVVYTLAERELLDLLPDGCKRVYCAASLDTVKARFAQRMNGTLPPPVAQMLEKLHGSFDNVPYDVRVDETHEADVDALLA